MKKLKAVLLQMVTEPNNTTVCPVRVLAILGFIYGFVSHAYMLFFNHAPFDWLVFWQGFGLGLGALGVALAVKKDSP